MPARLARCFVLLATLACVACERVVESDALARSDAEREWADRHVPARSRAQFDAVTARQRAVLLEQYAGPPPTSLSAATGARVVPGSLVVVRLEGTSRSGDEMTPVTLRVLVPSPRPAHRDDPRGPCYACLRVQQARGLHLGTFDARADPPMLVHQGWAALLPEEYFYDMQKGGTYRLGHLARRIETIDGPFEPRNEYDLRLTIVESCRADARHVEVTHVDYAPNGLLPGWKGPQTDSWNELHGCRSG